jgi:hypothetical protein
MYVPAVPVVCKSTCMCVFRAMPLGRHECVRPVCFKPKENLSLNISMNSLPLASARVLQGLQGGSDIILGPMAKQNSSHEHVDIDA